MIAASSIRSPSSIDLSRLHIHESTPSSSASTTLIVAPSSRSTPSRRSDAAPVDYYCATSDELITELEPITISSDTKTLVVTVFNEFRSRSFLALRYYDKSREVHEDNILLSINNIQKLEVLQTCPLFEYDEQDLLYEMMGLRYGAGLAQFVEAVQNQPLKLKAALDSLQAHMMHDEKIYKSLTLRNVNSLATCLAKVEPSRKQLFTFFNEEVQFLVKKPQRDDFLLKDLAGIASAFSRVNVPCQELYGAMSRKVEAVYPDPKLAHVQHWRMMARAFVIDGVYEKHVIILCFQTSDQELEANNKLDQKSMCQLMQVFTAVFAQKRALIKSLPERIVSFMQAHMTKLTNCKRLKPKSSPDHLKIVAKIREINDRPVTEKEKFAKKISVKIEVCINGFFVDIFIPEANLALEVNGPTHYDGEELDKKSKFKMFIIKQFGTAVDSIDLRVWNRLPPVQQDTKLITSVNTALVKADKQFDQGPSQSFRKTS